MTKNNVQFVKEYIEQIINQRRFDRLTDFCTEECVLHATPYVGLGVDFDDTLGEKLILTHMAPGGPAAAHLQIGDELLRVQDGDHIWETFDDLKKGLWARGLPNSEIILTVCRHGNVLTIPLRRERIEHFDMKVSEIFTNANSYWEKFWPEIKVEIREIFGSDDKVACYAINTGIHREYGGPAIWGELDILKFKDGRINEIWSIEDMYSQRCQLGYRILEPEREPA